MNYVSPSRPACTEILHPDQSYLCLALGCLYTQILKLCIEILLPAPTACTQIQHCKKTNFRSGHLLLFASKCQWNIYFLQCVKTNYTDKLHYHFVAMHFMQSNQLLFSLILVKIKISIPINNRSLQWPFNVTFLTVHKISSHGAFLWADTKWYFLRICNKTLYIPYSIFTLGIFWA